MIQRGVIVARLRPGAKQDVARIFSESDATELPRLAGVRHRSLFVLEDLYVHLIEAEGDVAATIGEIRDHPLFREISARLRPFVEPYNPSTWRSPRDAMAEEFYSWDANTEELA